MIRYLKKIIPGAGAAVVLLFLGCALFLPVSSEAQTGGSSAGAQNSAGEKTPVQPLLWGTDTGLYTIDEAGRVGLLWTGGKVRKIIRRPAGRGWVLLTDQGILYSENLTDWEQRSRGLPEKIIKIYRDGKKSFLSTVQEIKALAVNPENADIMVCAVKDTVYLTRDGGRNWENLGMPNYRTNGIKAVGVVSFPGSGGDITVFCSHGIYGVYRINPGKTGEKWTEMNAGLEKLETTENPDEISDFAVLGGEVYASQSFRRRIYRLDWERKSWNPLWSGGSEFGAVDSLVPGNNSLFFVEDRGIMELEALYPGTSARENLPGMLPKTRRDIEDAIKAIPGNHKPNCAVFTANSVPSGTQAGNEAAKKTPVKKTASPEPLPEENGIFSLSELWLIDDDSPGADTPEAAAREGIYLPVNHAMDPNSLKPYLDVIERRNLNMVVIDMKDDYGRLRFTPEDPSLLKLGRVFWPVNLEEFLQTMRERGIYTVARIVVFKDPEAARKNGERYAVWDEVNGKAWEGYYDTRRKKLPPGEEAETNPYLVTEVLPDEDPEYEILRTWYDEKWVDPYSEEIWDYNASVAGELHKRGFDEIQFDYIRFPTDGANLGDARFRWREGGMDMDSAILSFLRHVRSRVTAPISVDIYGANGWYRTGARTGQEVELLAPWVDVICPMYYPSHFEQDFLAQNPPELRPYRIYFQGTQRTRIIARNRVIVRPWAQAFYLNVSYDRQYYDANYVRREAEGVRAAGSGGLTYWNNSGRYDDLPYPAAISRPGG